MCVCVSVFVCVCVSVYVGVCGCGCLSGGGRVHFLGGVRVCLRVTVLV